ncbi:MAG: hypothetical protein J1E84_00870 [Muribaculaceae bacterium]|nr:hypothetical protein [Muribaculaceae bacterium]
MRKFITFLIMMIVAVGYSHAQTYSTRTISDDGKTSTWTFNKPSTNAVIVDNNAVATDNDIVFVSSGKKIQVASDGCQFNGGGIYIPVPAGSSGTLKMVTTDGKGSQDKWFSLVDSNSKTLPNKGEASFYFDSNDISVYESGTYLMLTAASYELKYIASFEVALTNGQYAENQGGGTGGGETEEPTGPVSELYKVGFSNGFDGFITQSTDDENGSVTAYYLKGTAEPTITSVVIRTNTNTTPGAVPEYTYNDITSYTYKNDVLRFSNNGRNYSYEVSVYGVAPFSGNGCEDDKTYTFTGNENWVKTGYVFDNDRPGWKFSKNDPDVDKNNDYARVFSGRNRIYFFLPASSTVSFESIASYERNITVYRNGVKLDALTVAPKDGGKLDIEGDKNNPYMIAIVSNNTSGDGILKSVTFTELTITGDGSGDNDDAEVIPEGAIEGSYSIRTISDGGRTSTWDFTKGKRNADLFTNVYPGVSDNDIWYIAACENLEKPKASENGNIRAHIDQYLHSKNGSSIYLPVPSGSSGAVTLKVYKKGNGTRYFQLYKDEEEVQGKRLYSVYSSEEIIKDKIPQSGPQSFKFGVSDITEKDGKSYILLKDVDGSGSGNEMKVASFTITLDNGVYSDVWQPAEECDDEFENDVHSHAVIHYNAGTMDYTDEESGESDSDADYTYQALEGTVSGLTFEGRYYGSSSKPFTSYTDYPIYYNSLYYTGFKLSGDAKYTLKATNVNGGRYLTSSVKVIGYNNAGSSKVKSFAGGEFDDASIEDSRSGANAVETILDFEIPAMNSIPLEFDGEALVIVDATYVDKSDLPSLNDSGETNQVVYNDLNGNKIKLTDFENIIPREGVIEFIPMDENQELYWFFKPVFKEKKKGAVKVSDDGAKVKKLSVLNYDFQARTGRWSVDGNWNVTELNDGGLRAMSADDAQPTVTIKIEDDGYFYYYVKDKSTGLNSVLLKANLGPTTGIEEVEADSLLPDDGVDGPMYNVYGQRVDENYRGLVIKNGRKFINK